MVTNLPRGLTINYKKELIEYFKTHYNVTCEAVNFVFNLKYFKKHNEIL